MSAEVCLNFETKRKRKLRKKDDEKKRKIKIFFTSRFFTSFECKSSGGRGTREHGEKERRRETDREFRCEWWFLTLSSFLSEKQQEEQHKEKRQNKRIREKF